MLVRRVLIYALVVVSGMSALRSLAQDAALTIDEAARLAVSQNLSVHAAREEVEASRARIGIARAGRKISVVGTAQFIHTNAIGMFTIPALPGIPPREVTAGVENNTIAVVRARQALYTGGRVSSLIDRAAALYDAALGKLATVEAHTALQAREAFYRVLLCDSLVASAEKNLAAATEQLSSAMAKHDAGTAAKFDVLRARTTASEAEQNLVQAKNQARVARIALAMVLGAPLTREFRLAEPPVASSSEQDVGTLIAIALKQHPELLTARAHLAAAEAGVRIAVADRRPEIDLSANYQFVGNENPGQATGVTFAASLSQEIFDGGRIRAGIAEARSLHAQAEARLMDTERLVEQDVRQSLLTLDTARQTLATARTRIAQAEEAYSVAQVRYEAGVGTATEIADALAALASARTSRDQAAFDYNIACARLQLAVGNPNY